ncbi:peptidyl-prolyl cis-trans isomerase [Flagellimonas hymeniacidonis]|uniref:Peptidyl-prolyl cis-trans isomerase n=1 Tax=Flagellimonas hymeniacidonis TaxID=2603628 RepID=A0A5C8UZF5_9FLAO|nr:peptidyl-prolyl cis-trans isomerase [Flagellimonas hymeniacidonis]TXN34295.1 peptidyl-prolyl cis-trans isomerase [Flagellimonas hymeniacidonis]
MSAKPTCEALSNCYFCEMLSLQKNKVFLFVSIGFLVLSSCDSLFKEKVEKEPLARVGDSFLYKEDIASFIRDDMSAQDSALFVTNYINNWASKQLLLSKSRINLPEEKLNEFDRLVADYRADLYTRAYIEALVLQAQDTAVTRSQLRQYYEKEKENFKLNEKLVQLRFVGLPVQFLDKDEVSRKMNNWETTDKDYLDSIAVQFKKIHFNDSIWVGVSRVIEVIPPLTSLNEEKYLKKSQFFELQDSLGVYLGKVTDVLEINDTAPFDYIAPDIRQLILNRRRLNYVRKLETEIIDEAIKKNEFEVYENNE